MQEISWGQKNLVLGLAADIPRQLLNGLKVEQCEQLLAQSSAEEAYQCFTNTINQIEDGLDEFQLAQLYQRRAAAAIAAGNRIEAAEDFLFTSILFTRSGLPRESEASALAGATALAEVAPQSAERILIELNKNVPKDVVATVKRGLVGGKVALENGDAGLAISRFNAARQGALDCGDSVSYFTAALSSARATESVKRYDLAYASLVTAWKTLSEILGFQVSGDMVRPELERLRDKIGKEKFSRIKCEYEEVRSSAVMK